MSSFNFSKKHDVIRHARNTLDLKVTEGSKHTKVQCENCGEITGISRGTGSITPGGKKRINDFFNLHPDNCTDQDKREEN